MPADKESSDWAVSYIAGLLTSGYILRIYFPQELGNSRELSPLILGLSGVFVGFGTRMGNGCTSGHGLCGLARLSYRSLASVITFMITGSLSSHLAALIPESVRYASSTSWRIESLPASPVSTAILVSILTVAYRYRASRFHVPYLSRLTSANKGAKAVASVAVPYVSGLVFGLGLGASGMVDSNRVTDFLRFAGDRGFDYTLMGVMGGGALLNLITFSAMSRSNASPLCSDEPTPTPLGPAVGFGPSCSKNRLIDAPLLIGAALFGLGWGLGGVCPGPSLVLLGAGAEAMHHFVPAMLLGAALVDFI